MATGKTKNTSSASSTKKSRELTPWENEQLETLKKINEYKEGCEANIVGIIYKNPELLRNVNLETGDFHTNCWRVYFEIAKEIIITEKKQTLDDITVGLYLSKHKKLEARYIEYGEYEMVEKAGSYTKEENLDSYIQELRKWLALMKLVKRGFGVSDRLSEFCDMTAEDIYQEYEVWLNDTFINVDSDVKSYDITDGIYDLIEELDQGLAVGLPYNNMPILTKETGGQYFGSITLVGGLSNVGKSTFARTSTIPSIIKNQEDRIVIMLNEDGIKKWQRELLVFVANNINKFDLQKHVVRDGRYSKEVKDSLKAAADWLVEQTRNHKITVIPFKQYQTSKVIKIINKFSSMGVRYFMLDTYKLDAGKVTDNSWLDLQQKMVEINDCVKPENKNVHILITFQLAKGSVKQRYYTQDNIGVSKNIIDPASTCIMIRDLYDDEYPGEKRELKVYRMEGKNNKTKIPVHLDKDKRYQILFIVKNREGSANTYQICIEHDMSRNTMKEIGICNVPIDF